MTSFGVRSLIVNGNTESTSTSTGTIRCTGGFEITGNVQVGGNIVAGTAFSGSALSSSNSLTVKDGNNTGTISQLGIDLTLSSSGNIIALATDHTLTFKNDNTVQITAYTGKEIVDECDTHTFIYNLANPSTPKYMLSATFALNQVAPGATNFTPTVDRLYCYQIRLVKGQVAKGAGFYLAVSGSPQVGYALYRAYDFSYVRVAQTATLTNVPTSGMYYLDYATPYTVPATGIYYTCIYPNTLGTSLTFVALATNALSYMNYTYSLKTGVLNMMALETSATVATPPLTMSGIAFNQLLRPAYSVVYTS